MRKWTKRIAIALLIPVLLIVTVIVLVYIPPIQNYLQREVTACLSRTTGMQISIERVDLRFPLRLVTRNVLVMQEGDTILSVEKFRVDVKLKPLLSGDIVVTDAYLAGGVINTAGLIPSIRLQGDFDYIALIIPQINMQQEIADIALVNLNHARLHLLVKDTVIADEDTVPTPLNWKINLEKLVVYNSAFDVEMPGDTLRIGGFIVDSEVKGIHADLGRQLYDVREMRLTQVSMEYDQGGGIPAKGPDPSHLHLKDLYFAADSLSYSDAGVTAVIHNLSASERSGLSITHMGGRIYADSAGILVPNLTLKTPHSEMEFTAHADWQPGNFRLKKLDTRLIAQIGREDVMLLAGDMPEEFRKSYPSRPLSVQLEASGASGRIDLSRLSAELPGVFTLTGEGEFFHVTDSVNRTGSADFHLKTGDLSFLQAMMGLAGDGSVVIPQGMSLGARTHFKGSEYTVDLQGREQEGRIGLNASLNTSTEAYTLQLQIDSLQIDHFLPQDSIRTLTASVTASGRGLDFLSSQATAQAEASVDRLEYGPYELKGISLAGELKNGGIAGKLVADNEYIDLNALAEYKLNSRYTTAKAEVNIASVDMRKLGLTDKTVNDKLSLYLLADIREDSVLMTLRSGDLQANLSASGPLEELMRQSMEFVETLSEQTAARRLDHAELRANLPVARIHIKAGRQNMLSRYLSSKDISFNDISAGFVATPHRGLNGGAAIHGLKVDTLQLDTIYMVAFQDTSRLNLRAGVINGPKNPQYTFRASLTGEVRSEDAEIMLRFNDSAGSTGLLLGFNVRPVERGILVHFIPDDPIVAFRRFAFKEDSRVFIRNNGRVLADVDMLDANGMGVSIHSVPDDTVSLQNLNIEIRRIELGDISRMFPYYPVFSGLFSAEANFRQTPENILLSAEARVQGLTWEGKQVGDMGLGATWLPGSGEKHHFDGYLSYEQNEILIANGSYYGGTRDSLAIDVEAEHFPLSLANVFMPAEVISLTGDIDGNLSVRGAPGAPVVNGELRMDDVAANSKQYGVKFTFDKRPLLIEDSRIIFDKYAIYTTGSNPFTIDGSVNFKDLGNPTANLSLQAKNYKLLDTSRRDGSLLYGKLFFDMNSTIRGPLSNLLMRGNINLLGNTDATYVLEDSPITVQDRLGDLVVFTSFADTLSAGKEKAQAPPAVGADVRLTINISQTAKLGVDLSEDRSSYINLEGGGSLSFQYTPEGDMTLTGRYTLTGGELKYSLPVISLKKFSMNQGSYVEWTGDPMDPNLNFKASERLRVNVPNTDEGSRMVNFDVSIQIKNTLNNLEVVLDLDSPEDSEIRQELRAMAAEERSKQAVAMMATGQYMARGSAGGTDNLINSVLQSQIENIAGSALKTVNISFGMDSYENEFNEQRTDYNFKYSQRFFNDRVQVVVGGSISTGENEDNNQTFIDNVSLEYRLDSSGTRYIRLYHNKNYESVLEGEIVETGVGLVLRRKVNRLEELFMFRKKKTNNGNAPEP